MPSRVYWVVPGRIAGRAGPSGPWGQPWDLREIANAGFATILSLDAEQCQASDVAAAGLRHRVVSIDGGAPPGDPTWASCRDALPQTRDFLRSETALGHQVLVHCAGGRDRTALVLADFLTATEALAPREAIARVRAERPDALDAEGWHDMAIALLSR